MDYHDSLTGQDHRYEQFLSHFCSIHNQVCDPWYPVTADMVRALAARDPKLDDDAYVTLSQVLRDTDQRCTCGEGPTVAPVRDPQCPWHGCTCAGGYDRDCPIHGSTNHPQ